MWQVPIVRLIEGVLLAAVVGHFVVAWFLAWIVHISRAERRENDAPRVPGAVLGVFERLLALIFVTYRVEGTATILLARMAAKLAANWQSKLQSGLSPEDDRFIRSRIFAALMAGTLSLGIGAVSGLVVRGDWAEILSPILTKQ